MTDDELRGEYDAQLRAKGRALIEGDPETNTPGDKVTYARHLVAVTEKYKGQRQGWVRITAEIERRCGLTAGFPAYDAWLEKQTVHPGAA